MKKTILTTAIALIFTSNVFASEPEQQETKVKADPIPTQTVKGPVCPAECTNIVTPTEQAKPVKKKTKKVKKSKPKAKTTETTALIPVREEILPLPKVIEAEPFSYKDIRTSLSYAKSNEEAVQIAVDLINNKDDLQLDTDLLETLSDGHKVSLVSFKSNLTDLTKHELENSKAPYLFQKISKEDNKSCYILSISYKFKGLDQVQNEIKYLNEKQQLVDSLPDTCEKNQITKNDNLIQTSNAELINISFNQSKLNKEGKIGFDLFAVKEGQGFIPNGLNSVAINAKMNKVYPLPYKTNKNGPNFGNYFESTVEPGEYHVLISYETGDKKETISRKVKVN